MTKTVRAHFMKKCWKETTHLILTLPLGESGNFRTSTVLPIYPYIYTSIIHTPIHPFTYYLYIYTSILLLSIYLYIHTHLFYLYSIYGIDHTHIPLLHERGFCQLFQL